MLPPTLFPTYLIPSLPFRRRQSSTDSTSTTTSSSSVPTTPSSPSFLAGHTSHLRCARCLADLASSSQIISKGFTGRHGRAYLVAPPSSSTTASSATASSSTPASSMTHHQPDLPNTFTHRAVPRQLVTGAHTVSDIACAHCSSTLGWKYVAAAEDSQRYKVGKFILETKKVCRATGWEAEGGEVEVGEVRESLRSAGGTEAEVEFDSQDEDECEDLFMGVWSPVSAARRRKAKKVYDE